ncbi:Protein FAM126B [Camellia lanceoleosa]|uniref:Protein FAM126B n=1 Tax=Camellia lanceoleosa TaxID=1840588 RepID=A0ACC0FVE6_9ERIC|nr:Protein FAM126B [Camellia lanceoleosa]
MDFHTATGSPSSSTSSSDPNLTNSHHHNGGHNHHDTDPMHSWWESISKARSRIHLLSSLLPPSSSSTAASFDSLADSDRPARSLLSSFSAYSALSSSLSSPLSGSGDDPLCQWLYETYQSSDTDLRLVVLSFIPLLSGIYLSRIHSSSASMPSLAGFEAVLLSLYAAETKSRAGKPVLVSIPDLSQPSLYHTPRNKPNPNLTTQSRPSIGVLSPPLEPQIAVKSTKRACIVGVALDCYFKQISQMPSWSKLDFCRLASDWAGQDCPCKSEFDNNENTIETNGFSDGIRVSEIDDVVEEMGNFGIGENGTVSAPKGARIPLPWELLQPVLRILGHCLLAPLNAEEVKDAASMAVRCLYARASHDLAPQAILATRSLIQLDKRARESARATAMATAVSNANTPSKAKKPEILLVSK